MREVNLRLLRMFNQFKLFKTRLIITAKAGLYGRQNNSYRWGFMLRKLRFNKKILTEARIS